MTPGFFNRRQRGNQPHNFTAYQTTLYVERVLMILVDPPCLGTQRIILKRQNNLSMEIAGKDLRQEALRVKTEQAQVPQEHAVANTTKENSLPMKPEEVCVRAAHDSLYCIKNLFYSPSFRESVQSFFGFL